MAISIAISSGHRKSWILAYATEAPLNKDGTACYLAEGGSLNLHCIKYEQLLINLNKLLSDLSSALSGSLKSRGITKDDRLVLSLPGVSSAGDRDLGDACVKNAGWPLNTPNNFIVVDDTYTGLIGGAYCTQGICAFAGTGASVYLGNAYSEHQPFIPDKTFKLDGFGPMIGDHGSGFRLAMATLERMGRDLDAMGWGAVVPLYEKILKGLGMDWTVIKKRGLQNGFDDLMANPGPEWRFKIADLATVITIAAADGDPYAQQQVTDAAKAMVRSLKTGIQLFPDLNQRTIYCQGGMFRHSKHYRDKVREYLDWPLERIKLARYKPIVGALLLAASQDWMISRGETTQNEILIAVEQQMRTNPLFREVLLNDLG